MISSRSTAAEAADREALLARRTRKTTRQRRTSTADLRFGLAMVVLAVIVFVVASVLVDSVRAGQRTNAAISAGLLLALVAVGVYSTVQKRRG